MRRRAGAPAAERSTDDWWSEMEDDILHCLEDCGPVPPAEVAGKLGVSEAAVTSLLSMMASEGKVKICLVQAR